MTSTRREFLAGSTASMLSLSSAARALDTVQLSQEDPLRFVDPMIGTGGHGHCYPGATVPFGMVQLSPDTGLIGWDHCSGYHHDDKSILTFSHTHLSGTGDGDMLDFGLMPSMVKPSAALPIEENPYETAFSHADEHAEPGYYAVKLVNGIRVELSATERTGLHRYSVPTTEHFHFLLDLVQQAGGVDAPPPVVAACIRVFGNDTIEGFRQTDGWAPGRKQYFVMQFSRPFQKVEIFKDGQLSSGVRAEGKLLRARVFFDPHTTGSIEVKTAISGVDIEGARRNLAAEAPGWAFDATHANAREAWRQVLSRISVSGGTERQKRIFYTGLYHAMVSPTLFDDVDGRYMGMDGNIHTLSAGEHNYSTFSLWDTYRAIHPLYTLLLPDRAPGIVNCLIRMANESPAGPPLWPLQGKETFCMTGYHSAVVIAEAATKLLAGVDLAAAWEPFHHRAFDSDRDGSALYRAKGYIPCDLVAESCSKTTDYCYDDWAVAHLARSLGHDDVYQTLVKRSGNFAYLYDPSTTFFRPRLNNGAWAEPFASNEMGHSAKWRDYTESNPWQTTFAVQHDPAALARLLGGRKALEAKLDAIFAADPTLPPDAPPDIAGLVGQYAHGNEPSHHIAYLYVYAGAPQKTQARIAMLCESQYADQPNGLAGNEDCGQMSAWYVMSALGFYAVDPVSGNYVFGTPLFDRAVIQLGGGRELTLVAKRHNLEDIYIQSIQWNGYPYRKLWFSHADIANGDTFVLEMGSRPNPSLGADIALAPPSRSTLDGSQAV